MKQSKIIGLTGGSGVGKSEAARLFAEFGALIIDADRLGHEVILKGATPAYEQILAEFGESILGFNGEIDRSALGAIVFNDKAKLKRLSEIVHKYIIIRIHKIIGENHSKPIVIDAAVLIEAGMDKICDMVLGIFAPSEARIARICARDGLTENEALRRVKSQMDDDELAQHIDVRIDNDGSLEQFKTKIKNFLAADFGD
ncbi:MAG: dephospho-CoA kinase [Clostridiales bacterium]|jgi:dephospho-CoA kinase|nr:dephospho-CoA kinase [Clostridiales bacterium]